MKVRVKRVVWKITKIIGITILSLLLILFLIPYVLPNVVSKEIKTLVNRSIDGEVSFTKARLSFFKHFPSLTLTLHNFTMKGSAPFKSDTLLSAGEMSFGIDIPALIKGEISVDKFFLTRADIRIKVTEKGEANYNVYKSSSSSSSTGSSSSGGDTSARLRIKKIIIEKSNLVYDDSSAGLLLSAKNLNYTGKGDLSKAIFDLSSSIKIDSFDFYLDRQPYILEKRIRANLVTSINTNSLSLKFQKNRMRINKLPLDFTGRFDFLSNGYDMDFRLKSREAGLEDLFSVLPPAYQGWMDKTIIKGKALIVASLYGKQVFGTDSLPDLEFNMKIRDGYIAYEKAPAPISNIYFDFQSNLPSLNVDSFTLNADSLYFIMNEDYFSSVLQIKGYKTPYVFARVNSSLDLENFDKALGLQVYDLKGKLNIQSVVDGRFTRGQDPASMRKNIVVTSIPSFYIKSSLQNGYFHYTALPAPIKQINFNILASCPDHDYHHASASIDDIDIKALNNYLAGFIRLNNVVDFPIDANLDGVLNLADIKQVYPLDSLDINGNMTVKIRSSGNYQPAKKVFPKTEALLKVENASLKTKYYPAPIEKIAVDATVKNKRGTFYDLEIDLKPVSFEFEGKPFMVKADLQNFDNLKYDIVSKGVIDIGRIYRVFSYKGLDVKGIIETDLSLKGSQADAEAGRLSRLNNKGTLKLRNIIVSSELYPLPFFIDRGFFRFHQDNMRFEEFRARYGTSVVTLDGAVSNLFKYMMNEGPLRGELKLGSDHILLDELMAYKADATSVRPDSLAAGSSGVILLPDDLDLKLVADIRSVDYNKLKIKDLKGQLQLTNGEFRMNETGFTMADAVTTMNVTYKSLSPLRALFTYHITINDFDVKKMYKEVEMFRKLAPAAASAEGIISVDYGLEGKLNSDMYPIMPSLKGGGVVSVKNVKMKGFKLFSAMGKETGKEEIEDPDLSKINLKTTIKNNIVTLEKTKMKVSGFRLRIQGQTSLDGKLKMKCRIGLPPFGIIGIPVSISGTGQSPKIKVGKGDKLPLEEQQEEEEDIDK